MYQGQGGGVWPIPGALHSSSKEHLNGLYPNVPTSNSSGPFPGHNSNNPYSQQHTASRMQPGGPGSSSLYGSAVNSGPSGLMLPPSSSRSGGSSAGRPQMPTNPNKTRTTVLQEEKKRAAHQRFLEQQEREQAKKATQDLFANPCLFREPERVSDEEAGQVAQVLGMFSDARNLIDSKTSFVGIEYQPPTPAPSLHHHIIGDEDDDRHLSSHPTNHNNSSMSGMRMSEMGHPSVQQRQHHSSHQQQQLLSQQRRAPMMPRPPPSQRLPENINQTHRPTDRSASRQTTNVSTRQLPPPSGPISSSAHMRPGGPSVIPQLLSPLGATPAPQRNSSSPGITFSPHHSNLQHHNHQHQAGPYSSAPDVTLNSSRVKQVGKSLSKLPLDQNQIDDERLQAMILEMKAMPPPLSAIVTPRVDLSSHMGNTGRLGVPKYSFQSMLPPLMKPLDSPPQSTKMERPSDLPPLSRPQEIPKVAASSLNNPCLSEDSDSDNPKSSDKSSSKSSIPPPPARAASTPTAATTTTTAVSEPSNPKFSSNNSSSGDTSSDESSSDDSSSEDEDKKKWKNKKANEDKTDITNRSKGDIDDPDEDDDDDTSCIDNVFSLSSLIGRVRSTHSPGGPNSNMSQHQPSPRNPENIASTLNSLGLPPDSPSDGLDNKDDDDPISGFLSHTPQPLPDLVSYKQIDDLGIPLSPMPQSPLPATPPQNSTAPTTNVLPPTSITSLRNDAPPTSIPSRRNDDTSDEEMIKEEVRRKPKRATKSPTKRATKKTSRISEDSEEDAKEKVLQQQQQQKRTPARSTPSGRPLPRASATPVAKSPTQSDEDDEIIDPILPEASKKAPPRKRRTNQQIANENEKRMKSKSCPATPTAPAVPLRPPPVSNAYITSSSSDEEAKREILADSGAKTRRKTAVKRAGSKSSQSSNSPSKSVRSGGKNGVKVEVKTEEEDEDEKASEKERSNKKTAAISMIFASSKAGKNTGKSGIKVEVHHQPAPSVTPQPVEIMLSPPTVAIKSQGLSNAATLISHSPAPLAELPKRADVIRRRADGRPILLCRIPFDALGPAIRELFSRKVQKENATPSENAATSRERRQSECSTVSSSSSRLSFKRRRRREDSVCSETGVTSLQPPTKRAKNHFESPTNLNSSSGASGGDTSNLMPPPNRVFYSYMEHRRPEEEEFADDDLNNYMSLAKRLKHEADNETIHQRKAIKYLQAVLYFSLCGNFTEVKGDKTAAFNMYKETLDLIRHVTKAPPLGSTIDTKLAVLSHRCQSLLYLRLYKLNKKEFSECQKILGDHLMKANTGSEHNSPNGQQQPTISPTPSPAGSEGSVCSKSSGYTSASELMGAGLSAAPSLTVPQSVMQKQHQYCNFLSQCHELWEMADLCAHRGHCEDFIIRLDRMHGPLTLHSSVKDLVKYTQFGLEILSKEREQDR